MPLFVQALASPPHTTDSTHGIGAPTPHSIYAEAIATEHTQSNVNLSLDSNNWFHCL